MVYFVEVLVIAAASVSPLSRPTLALVLGIMVVINVVPGAQRLRRLRGFHQADPFEWRDWLWYLLFPLGCQFLLLAAAIGLLLCDPPALPAIASAPLLLLVTGVRNAWD